MQMDTFYAHTDTFVEMRLASLLAPGRYTVRLTLDDASEGARAQGYDITLVVEELTESAAAKITVPGLIEVIQNTGARPMSLIWSAAIIAVVLLGLLIVCRILILRRHRSTISQ
jgi:hypothetical protein